MTQADRQTDKQAGSLLINTINVIFVIQLTFEV